MGGCSRSLISLKKTSRLYFQTLVSARNKSSQPSVASPPQTHAHMLTNIHHTNAYTGQPALQMVVEETEKGNEGNLQSPVTALPDNR